MQPTTVVARHAAVVEADVGSTHVLLSDALAYHGVEGTGRRIWELLETPRSVEELVTILLQEYAVDREECLRSVAAFVSSLHGRGLVVLSA